MCGDREERTAKVKYKCYDLKKNNGRMENSQAVSWAMVIAVDLNTCVIGKYGHALIDISYRPIRHREGNMPYEYKICTRRYYKTTRVISIKDNFKLGLTAVETKEEEEKF